jgi:hypothetical protein
VPEHDHRTGVRVGLQQSRHELHLIGADQLCRLFQVQVVLEPGGQHVAVRLPPARRAGLPGEREQPVVLGGVLDAVQLEQIGDIALLDRDPAELHPADLRLGAPDRPAGLIAGDAFGLAQAPEPGAQLHAPDRRTTVLLHQGRYSGLAGGDVVPAAEQVLPDSHVLPAVGHVGIL